MTHIRDLMGRQRADDGGGAATIGPAVPANVPTPKTDAWDNEEAEEKKLKKKIQSPVHLEHISKRQLREYREAFRLFDKDGDGTITKEELGRVMHSLGQFARTEELQQMLLEVDVDGDGNVSFEEFVSIAGAAAGGGGGGARKASMVVPGTVTDLRPEDAQNVSETTVFYDSDEDQELRDAFRVFDKHNRGFITASDLRAVLQCLGEDLSEEEIEDMIKEVDVDGDGRIDFYEFVNALGEPGNEDSYDDDDEDLTGDY